MHLRIPSWAIFSISLFFAVSLTAIAAPAVAKEVTDQEVTWAIEEALLQSDAVNSNMIDVSTKNGIVTLTGTVTNMLARERAERISAHTVGVRGIVDRILVNAPGEYTDKELAEKVNKALLRDPTTDAYEVLVNGKDGTVTLIGTVDSWQEKQLCESVAKSVPGVEEVVNDIDIHYSDSRPDMEILADVQGRLASDVLVDDMLIDVAVENGHVSLTGMAGSLAEKNRAMADAWVTGTASVDVDGLKLDWWLRDDMRRYDLYENQSDESIRKAVEDAFLYDPRVYEFKVDVQVDGGTAILSGTVDNLMSMKAAEEDARNVVGVWRVKNHMKVRPENVPSNEILEDRVMTAFINDPYLERTGLKAMAADGTVYLSGSVNTTFEKFHAQRLAQSVTGVVSVVNDLKAEHVWTWKPDHEILEDVRDELFWSPFVNEDKVQVQVDRGIVTLSGNVATWSERRMAEDSAFDAGAKDVRNDLAVTFKLYGPHLYWPL